MKRFLATALAMGIALVPVASRAVIVERVVAVVGERPILLSDLRKRARPYLVHIHQTVTNSAQQAAQESEMYNEVLTRMIDDRLEEQASDKAHITVTSDEIDRGVNQKAAQLNIAPKELLAEAKRQGLSEQDYRDEIRRQVLEGKLIQLRVMSRVRVTDEDARAAYGHWVKENGDTKYVRLHLLALRVPPDAAGAQQTQALAAQIVAQARGGADFCALVTQHSPNPASAKNCGDTNLIPLTSMFPEMQETAATLKRGDISNPIQVGTDALVIAQGVAPPGVPSFEDVKPFMVQRAEGEVIERQRKLWLQELRRGVYVDVRLH